MQTIGLDRNCTQYEMILLQHFKVTVSESNWSVMNQISGSVHLKMLLLMRRSDCHMGTNELVSVFKHGELICSEHAGCPSRSGLGYFSPGVGW